MAHADRYREDSLWTKYREIKGVLDGGPRVNTNPHLAHPLSPHRRYENYGAAVARSASASPSSRLYYPSLVGPRFDDSGRVVDMTEVQTNLFIGSEGAAKNTFYLKRVGVTHVLNTAEGSRIGCVDTNAKYYKPFGIKYKGLQLLDVPQTNISVYFNDAAEFIDEALRGGGRVLVNCLMGMSRSATCVLAFLMLRRDLSAVQALTEVRRHRDVRPNDGFLRQLADLDNKLRRDRGRLRDATAAAQAGAMHHL